MKEIKEKINRDDLIYISGNKKKDKTFDFEKTKTIKSFARGIYSGNLTLDDPLEEQINSKDEFHKFKEPTKPKNQEKKEQKAI